MLRNSKKRKSLYTLPRVSYYTVPCLIEKFEEERKRGNLVRNVVTCRNQDTSKRQFDSPLFSFKYKLKVKKRKKKNVGQTSRAPRVLEELIVLSSLSALNYEPAYLKSAPRPRTPTSCVHERRAHTLRRAKHKLHV